MAFVVLATLCGIVVGYMTAYAFFRLRIREIAAEKEAFVGASSSARLDLAAQLKDARHYNDTLNASLGKCNELLTKTEAALRESEGDADRFMRDRDEVNIALSLCSEELGTLRAKAVVAEKRTPTAFCPKDACGSPNAFVVANIVSSDRDGSFVVGQVHQCYDCEHRYSVILGKVGPYYSARRTPKVEEQPRERPQRPPMDEAERENLKRKARRFGSLDSDLDTSDV